jgi:hypothetical protein
MTYDTDPATGGVLIPLHGRKHTGYHAIIDPEDVERVTAYRWRIIFCGRYHTYQYVHCRALQGTPLEYLHRFVLNATDRSVLVDHENHNGLDCRKANLRLCTRAQNMQNRKPDAISTSAYKGVGWNKKAGKWRVRYRHNGRQYVVGYFADEHEAARAYDQAVIAIHGEFALPNLPGETVLNFPATDRKDVAA